GEAARGREDRAAQLQRTERAAELDLVDVDRRDAGRRRAHQRTSRASNTGPSVQQYLYGLGPWTGTAQPRQTPKPQAICSSRHKQLGTPNARPSSRTARSIGVGPHESSSTDSPCAAACSRRAFSGTVTLPGSPRLPSSVASTVRM